MFRYGRRVIIVCLMVLLFALAVRESRVFDPDFWWHLKTGETIVATKSIPASDDYSYTNQGRQWVAHEWLSEILIYAVHRPAGPAGLVLAFALVITLAYWLTYLRCRCPPIIAGGAVVLGALASTPVWGVRPQMFTLLLASAYLFILDGYVRRGRARQLWWLVPLMALWVNLHGGFAIGLALVVLTAAGLALDVLAGSDSAASVWLRVKPLLLALAACLAAGLLSPHGLRLYLYPLETVTSRAQQAYIAEWHSPDFHNIVFLPLAVLIIGTLCALAVSPKRARLSELLILSAMCYASLRSARHLPFLTLAATPLLAEHTFHWISTFRWGGGFALPEKPVSGVQTLPNVLMLAAAVCAAALLTVRVLNALPTTVTQTSPVAAVEFIRAQRLAGPIYNTYEWGGFLIHRLYPEHRVYIDGRADMYGDAFFDEFMKVYDGEDRWEEVFQRYGVRTVLVKPRAPLATLLRQRTDWAKVFEDDQSVIFTR